MGFPAMTDFLAGLLVMGNGVAALFFARFWHETRDRLFLFFAAAFTILAIHRALLAATPMLHLSPTWVYAIRLMAFLLILAAIVDKNRSMRY
jgi:hypothetical protein